MTTQSPSTYARIVGAAAWVTLIAAPAKAGERSDGPGCAGTGPQAPRDIEARSGSNPTRFATAPRYQDMNLCNIHVHSNAEHKGEGFATLMGKGDHRGYVCDGEARGGGHAAATRPSGHGGRDDGGDRGDGCGGVSVGDTVEVHWVFSTCVVAPGPGLGSCLSATCTNPQLRVEAAVFYLTDGVAGELDFADYRVVERDGRPQPGELPSGRGAVEYPGSTTGPSFDNVTTCSPLQVTWNVRRGCKPLAKRSLDRWCRGNAFDEGHAHGVRRLVTAERLLAPIH